MRLAVPQLTFTRFIAAISIVVYHFGKSQTILAFPFINKLMPFLAVFVDYFFVLSGFLLTISTINRNQKEGLLQFYINRFARVYPLYGFSLVILFLLSTTKIGEFSISKLTIKSVITNVFLLQSWWPEFIKNLNYPSWSLSVEVFLYFSFPFIYQYLKDCTSLKITIISLVLWVFTQTAYVLVNMFNIFDANLKSLPVLHVPTFVAGIATGLLFVRHQDSILNQQVWLKRVTVLISVIYIGLVSANVPLLWFHELGLFSPLFVAIILLISTDRSCFTNLLKTPILIYLGEISYSIYLLQVPFSSLFYTINRDLFFLNNKLAFVFFSIFLIFFSIVCYELIEKPWRVRMKRLLTYS